MDNESVAQFFLRTLDSLAELEEILKIQDCESLERSEDFCPMMQQFKNHLNQVSSGLAKPNNVLERLKSINVEEVQKYESKLNEFIQNGISFPSLSAFASECEQQGPFSDLIPVKEAILRAFYAQLLLSNFLGVPRPAANLFTKTPAPPSLTADELMERYKAGQKIVDAMRASVETKSNPTDSLIDEVTLFCTSRVDKPRLSKKTEIHKVLERFLNLAASLRDELIKDSFRGSMKDFENTIKSYSEIAESESFGVIALGAYGRYFATLLTESPQQVLSYRLERLLNNIGQAIQLAHFERAIVKQHGIRLQWLVSPRFLRINEFQMAMRVFKAPEGEYLLSQYYSQPILFDYDLEQASIWATKASIQGHASAQILLAECDLISQKSTESAISWYEKAFLETNVMDVGYKVACLLLRKKSAIRHESEAGISLAKKLANAGHPASQHLVGVVLRDMWRRNKNDADLDNALKFFKAAADQEFGAAKVEVELYALEGWFPSGATERELSNLRTLALQGDAAAAYRYFTQFLPTMRGKLRPKEIVDTLLTLFKEATFVSIEFDFLRGQLLYPNCLSESVEYLEKAAIKGHPKACRMLSEIFQKDFNDLDASIHWESKHLENNGFYDDSAIEKHPLGRLHELKKARFKKLDSRTSTVPSA